MELAQFPKRNFSKVQGVFEVGISIIYIFTRWSRRQFVEQSLLWTNYNMAFFHVYNKKASHRQKKYWKFVFFILILCGAQLAMNNGRHFYFHQGTMQILCFSVHVVFFCCCYFNTYKIFTVIFWNSRSTILLFFYN